HTHNVIGSGAGDPEKLDPAASRETLDHSVMYIFAVALQDGRFDHHDSYTPDRAAPPAPRSFTPSPSPSRTDASTTTTATPPSGRPGPTRCGSGTGSRRSRTP